MVVAVLVATQRKEKMILQKSTEAPLNNLKFLFKLWKGNSKCN